MLNFSVSYQNGSSIQSARCSLLSGTQYSCTANLTVDINPSVDTVKSFDVTVNGPHGSNSSQINPNLG